MSLMMGSDSPSSGRFPPPSDPGSERQKDVSLGGVPFHHPRSNVYGRHLTDKGFGSKRSNSDFTCAGHDGFDKLHSVKIYRGGSGGEQLKRLNNEEIFCRSKALKPSQARLPHLTHSNTNEYSAIWDRAVTMNVPGSVPHPSYISPITRQVHSVTLRDAAAGPSIISHVAANEGSKNRKNEAGVWNLMMKSSMVSDKSNPKSGRNVSELSGAFVAGRKFKAGTHLPEPESPIPGRTKSSSSSRQMTIFYDGHAYVFDDVHPYKAEIIMAMAGSNATSCLSTLSAKSSMIQVKEGSTPTGESKLVLPVRQTWQGTNEENLPLLLLRSSDQNTRSPHLQVHNKRQRRSQIS